jgi:hypothetical protein
MPHRTRLAAAVLLLALAAGCGSAPAPAPSEAAGGGILPADFPADFPLPPGADVTSRGDSVTLAVPTPAAEVRAFLVAQLAATGWDRSDDWEGVAPDGAPTAGWTVARGEDAGVVAIVEEEDRSIVHVNLAQPRNDPQRGMGLYRD